MPSLITEHEQWFDEISGEPLNDGYVYIGARSLDPQTNLITIYSDRALTVPISNPQRTGSDGRTVNKIYVPGKYSIEVEDTNNVSKYINLDNGEVGDGKQKVSSNDTTEGYLNGKLVAGTDIEFTENNDGANETLSVGLLAQTLSDYANPANSIINITELSESEITITIPTGWNTYNVEAFVSSVIVETGASASDTNMTLRLKEGSGTGGAIFGSMQGIVGISAGVDNILPMTFGGFLEGETATGAITWTLTSIASANSGLYELQDIRWWVKCHRLT